MPAPEQKTWKYTYRTKEDIIVGNTLRLYYICVSTLQYLYRYYQEKGFYERSRSEEFIAHVAALWVSVSPLISGIDFEDADGLFTKDMPTGERLDEAIRKFKKLGKKLKEEDLLDVSKKRRKYPKEIGKSMGRRG